MLQTHHQVNIPLRSPLKAQCPLALRRDPLRNLLSPGPTAIRAIFLFSLCPTPQVGIPSCWRCVPVSLAVFCLRVFLLTNDRDNHSGALVCSVVAALSTFSIVI